MRVGMGYDVHKLVENRKLILGGVEIPYEYGLLGHSDADVLVHAIMDALLGAAALRDIGRHFPDNDPAYEGADSIELLKKVGEMLEERMYLIENIDAMWRRRFISKRIRSISRQRPRKDLALPERKREFPHRRSAAFPRHST